MKKTIAVLLACIMLLACAPLTAFADETITGTQSWDSARTISAGQTLVVNGTLTVTAQLTNYGSIVINENGSLEFKGANGRLNNEGTVTVKNRGNISFAGTGTQSTDASLYNGVKGMISFGTSATGLIAANATAYNYGDITNSSKIVINGELLHNVKIPGSYSVSYKYQETWNRMPTTVNFDVFYYMYEQGDTDDAYSIVENFKKYPVGTAGKDILVPDGEKLFIMIVPRIGADGTGEWVSAERMVISAGTARYNVTTILDTESPNAKRTPEYGAVFTLNPANACTVTVETTKYKDLVKIFDITLPRTEAYYVITDNNEVDRVDVEFGKTLSFRLVLEPDYDKSDSYVYVNSIYMEPEDYGYYRISGPMESEGFATAGGVQDDLTITVMGITSNESQEQLGGVVALLQEIVSIIEEIFSYFLSLFEGLGSSFGGTTSGDVVA